MVKHIVLFKLKDTLSKEEKCEVMNRFKAAIEALPEKIEVIRKVFVGLNMNEAEQWDICLESEFDTLDDVKLYAAHPDHVAAACILKDAKADRACADYEF
ncbi:MAG: Dabb family protein [Bacteroidaceae bacterium]|nr:Dabb family protein [Bacteroidaceae bacterium]